MRAGKVLSALLKLIVIPSCLGLIGYFFVGPRIGKPDLIKKLPVLSEAAEKQSVAANSAEPEETPQFREPSVEVTVTDSVVHRRRRANARTAAPTGKATKKVSVRPTTAPKPPIDTPTEEPPAENPPEEEPTIETGTE